MKVLIVFDSRFGKTEELAREMGTAVSVDCEVEIVKTPPVLDAHNANLLIVGGPTEAHGMSAALRQTMRALPKDKLRGLHVAVFDTRFRAPALLTGSAAKGAASRLEKAGCILVAPPESFFVRSGQTKNEDGKSEPELLDGELERAGRWAREVTASLTAAGSPAFV
jgi:flavodoxin